MKKAIRKYQLNLHYINDAKLIEKLDKQANKQAYIKSLIEKDLKNE